MSDCTIFVCLDYVTTESRSTVNLPAKAPAVFANSVQSETAVCCLASRAKRASKVFVWCCALCGLPSLLCLDFCVCCFELGGCCLLACAITNNTNNTNNTQHTSYSSHQHLQQYKLCYCCCCCCWKIEGTYCLFIFIWSRS